MAYGLLASNCLATSCFGAGIAVAVTHDARLAEMRKDSIVRRETLG